MSEGYDVKLIETPSTAWRELDRLFERLRDSFVGVGRAFGMSMQPARELVTRLEGLGRYARGQKRKKPRGRRAKERSRELWLKHIERRRRRP